MITTGQLQQLYRLDDQKQPVADVTIYMYVVDSLFIFILFIYLQRPCYTA